MLTVKHGAFFQWRASEKSTKTTYSFNQGNSIKDSSKPVKLEQVLIDDIQPNDFFLICTDGITETWIDSDLEELFSKFNSSNDIIQEIVK